MPPTRRTARGQLSLPQPSASLAFLSLLLKLVKGHLRLWSRDFSPCVKTQKVSYLLGSLRVESECGLEVGVIWGSLPESWENRTVQISCLRAQLHFASSCNKQHVVYHAWKMHKYPPGKRNYSPLKHTFGLEIKRCEDSFLAPPQITVLCFTFGNRVKLEFYLEKEY